MSTMATIEATPSIPDLTRLSVTNSTMSDNYDKFPLYPAAVILPLLAFPSIILNIPPLVWHFSQRNIAAWSLMLWIMIHNFFLAINPLIWPRDNVDEWWDGAGLCDIEARFIVGSVVAVPCAIACIMRKLARVMDTGNITVVPQRNQVVRDNVLEVACCWGFPVLMMLIYYIVQPLRYFITGISGCVAAYDGSWLSVLLSWMWSPIIMLIATYYAALLLYRLYRYRREFSRLMAARSTTKSRFLRLVLMALILVLGCLPYTFWIFSKEIRSINSPFIWRDVHGPNWNTVVKVPMYGTVWWDVWGHVVIGYVAFAVFGTGADAKDLYRRGALGVGLGSLWPSLYEGPGSRASQSNLGSSGGHGGRKSWWTVGSKTRDLFSFASKESHKGSATDSTISATDHTASFHPGPDVIELDRTSSTAPLRSQHPSPEPTIAGTTRSGSQLRNPSILTRLFPSRHNHPAPVLPVHESLTGSELAGSTAVQSHAWASPTSEPGQSGGGGVRVMREVEVSVLPDRGREADIERGRRGSGVEYIV